MTISVKKKFVKELKEKNSLELLTYQDVPMRENVLKDAKKLITI